MSAHGLAEDVKGFLKEYMDVFAALDGPRIAALYHAPCVTVRTDGSIHCLQSPADIAGFFQAVAEAYYRDGIE